MFKITSYIFIITFLFLSCQDSDVLGCTDESACNYNQEATNDNNTCFYPEDWEDNCGMCDLVPSNDCEQDECGVWGGDGEDADADGICDDVDDCVGEYDDCGVCNGGNADQDDCGVCFGGNADQDCNGDCFGDAVVDECGVCNGNGEYLYLFE